MEIYLVMLGLTEAYKVSDCFTSEASKIGKTKLKLFYFQNYENARVSSEVYFYLNKIGKNIFRAFIINQKQFIFLSILPFK